MTDQQLTQAGPAIAVAGALDARTLPIRHALLNSAAVATVALSLWASAAGAQDTQAQGTEQAQQSDQSQQSGEAGQTADGGQQAQGQGNASDALVATVGDAEIRNSDLMRAIGALPPQLNSQPPEMLVPIALQQLVVREAIVQQARSQGLAEDPEVQSLVEGATQSAEEDALVQVWLQREITNRVTPEAVDQAYAGLDAVAGDQPVPPLEEIRPQIEQSLTQQALNDIQSSLLSNAQVTLYGPDGQPLQQPQGNAAGAATTDDGQSGDAEQSGDASGAESQSLGNAAGGDAASGDQGNTEEQPTGN